MAGPFYVDISAPGAWNGRAGTDHVGAEWLGISGFQKALDTAVVGEIVYIKGTGDASKNYTVPYDANTGNLTDGEAVTWHDGAGVVHFTGAMATPVEIELTSGNVCTDNDVITGTTSTSTITQNGAASQYTIDVDTNAGTNAGGWIKYIGVNSSWAQDGTRAIFDFNSAGVHGLTFSGVPDMTWWENIEVQECGGSAKDGFRFNASSVSGAVFINCSAHNNSGSGFGGTNQIYCTFIRCTSYLNTVSGLVLGIYDRYLFCSAHDNTVDGFTLPTGMEVFVGCLAYDNGDDGFGALHAADILFNCVVNGNTDDGIELLSSTPLYSALIAACRITNHSGAGDIGLNANSEPCLTLGCYFEDNDGDNIQNATLHRNISIDGTAGSSNIEDQANTNEGYTDKTDGAQDFNLRSDASLRRTAVTIPVV